MTSRIVKVRPPAESAANSDSPVITSQRKQPEARYWLQVDRQTKSSHATSQAAEEAGALIKSRHPIVQVSVYDHIECVSKIIGAAGSEAKAPPETPATD